MIHISSLLMTTLFGISGNFVILSQDLFSGTFHIKYLPEQPGYLKSKLEMKQELSHGFVAGPSKVCMPLI